MCGNRLIHTMSSIKPAIGPAMMIQGSVVQRVLCMSQVHVASANVGLLLAHRSFAQRRVLRPPRMVPVKAAAVEFFGGATWEELGVLSPEVEKTLHRQNFARPSRVQVRHVSMLSPAPYTTYQSAATRQRKWLCQQLAAGRARSLQQKQEAERPLPTWPLWLRCSNGKRPGLQMIPSEGLDVLGLS